MTGTCKHCSKPTRSENTSMCQACYKLDLAVRNNPRAAQSILDEHVKTLPKGWMNISPYAGREYVSQTCIYDKNRSIMVDPNPYLGTQPKEEQ